jgi:hypothetical protein
MEKFGSHGGDSDRPQRLPQRQHLRVFSPVAKSRCWGRPTQALGFALARYTPTGKLDTTFGSNGTLITSFAGDFVTANALAIQLGGKIVAVGSYATDGQK